MTLNCSCPIAINTMQVQDKVYDRIVQLNDAIMTKANAHGYFEIQEGAKYFKVIHAIERGNGTGRSVHSFVNKRTGELYKAASWKAPAKYVRYRLLDDDNYQKVLKCADIYGSYLYLK